MQNFEGTYEIMGAEGPCGTLEVTSKGLYILFCAHCSALAGVQRLAVSDHEREYVLGVLMPSGDGCALRRLISQTQLKQTGLTCIKLAYIAGLDRCYIKNDVQQPQEGVPLNIGGEFACPENFLNLELESREDGLYAVPAQ